MSIAQEQYGAQCSSPLKARKMGIEAITDMETPPPSRRGSQDEGSEPHLVTQTKTPQTPPESTPGSPHIKPEQYSTKTQPTHQFSVRLSHPETPLTSPVRLPSLEEFDQGVEALARSYGPPPSWTPSSTTLPSISRAVHDQQSLPPFQPYSPPDPYSYHLYSMTDPHMHIPSPQAGYPSPPPEGENRHINKKYTTEEGDFIIYAWHDKKQKWQSIQKDFARLFGRTPERTIQGLQAWYYRMNQRIPVWDQDGWLVFDDEDDIEPRYISIKCRERDAVHKSEPLGLAQRYPERAIHYHWVDAEVKHQSRDWAAKRAMQYRDRQERRKRKEQRRARL